jgi:hypothetical protein
MHTLIKLHKLSIKNLFNKIASRMQKGRNMNKFKLFSVLVLVFIASYSFAQWTFVGGVTGAGSFPSVSAVDANTVYIGGGPSGVAAIFKSTNGGVAFTPVTTTGITLELFCLWVKDANTIFGGDGGAAGGAGGNAHVWKTTNAGVNWTSALSTGGTVGFINGVVFSRLNPLNGFAESDPPTSTTYWVQKTTDGGNNWTLQNPASLGSGWASGQNTLFMVDNLFYGFGSSGPTTSLPKSYITSDGGTTWYSAVMTGAPVGSTQHFCSNVTFSTNKLNGIGGSSNTSTTCARTTNGGVSWFAQTIPSTVTTGYFNAKWVPNSSTVFIVNSPSTGATQSFKSTDNGATWTSLTWPAGVTYCTHMDMYYTGGVATLYAACSDGSVCKLTQTITGVNDPQTSIPSDYKLEQNYPNPFNPTTTINYSIPKASFVTLKIYDVLGNEVMTVVNEQQSAKEYSYTVDFSKMTSGVYYYTIKAGSYSASKKLMLVK